MILKTSLTCIDERGCLNQHCIQYYHQPDYATLIDLSSGQNSECCWADGNARNQCIGGFNDEAFDDKAICMPELNEFANAKFEIQEQIELINIETEVSEAIEFLKLNDALALTDPDLIKAEAFARIFSSSLLIEGF